jgi:hypothetical protein
MKLEKKMIFLFVLIMLVYFFWIITLLEARAEPPKSRFYDFSEQVIDGHIKKPTALYTEGKESVVFDRLLKLKKSFIPEILETSKDPIFQK